MTDVADRSHALRVLQDAAYEAGAEDQREAIARHFAAHAADAARRSGRAHREAAALLQDIAADIRRRPLVRPGEVV